MRSRDQHAERPRPGHGAVTLEERLDPRRFFRIHRSAIVRLDLIDTLLRSPGGDYAVRLKSGVGLKVSRSRLEELEQPIGLST